MEEYKFPENNWYIEIDDDNRKLVNDWKVNQEYNDDLFKDINYKYVEFQGGGNYKESTLRVNSIKITTEQFRQYVLKESYKFKVGDKVRLLKSTNNWDNESMTKIVSENPIVEITEIEYHNNTTNIRFENDGTWQWCFENGHFELYKETTQDYSYLEQILNKLGL